MDLSGVAQIDDGTDGHKGSDAGVDEDDDLADVDREVGGGGERGVDFDDSRDLGLEVQAQVQDRGERVGAAALGDLRGRDWGREGEHAERGESEEDGGDARHECLDEGWLDCWRRSVS